MQVNYETENREKSQVLLKITVAKEEVKKEYDDILSKTQKDVTIKGFRKGKVPVSILESKFKKSFLAEVSNKIIDEAYKDVFDKLEKKPLGFSKPELEEFNLPELEKDFTFELVYDTEPEIKVGDFRKMEVEKIEIKIADKDIKEELDKYRKEFATIEEKKTKITKGDIAQVEYTVFEGDKEFDKKDSEYVNVGKDFDLYKLGSDITGLKSGEETEISKTFDKEDNEKIAGKELKIKLKIKEVKTEKMPKLDDELAKKINKEVNTVDELKENIQKQMEEFSVSSTKNKTVDSVMEKLIETFEGEIPQSMINYQLDNFYNQLVQQVGGDEKRVESFLRMENLNKESYKEKMTDKAEKMIKQSLILKKIIKDEKIEPSEEDIKSHLENFAKMYKMKADDLYETYKKSGNLDFIKEEVASQKAVDFIFENAAISKTKKVSLKEYEKLQNKE